MKKLEEALKGSVSKVGKSANGSSMIFTTLNLAEKELERLFPSIHVYKQVNHLDLNSNSIVDISLLKEFN